MKTKFILLLFILLPLVGYTQTNKVQLPDSVRFELFNRANNDSIYYATIIELNNERNNAVSNGNEEMLDTIYTKLGIMMDYRNSPHKIHSRNNEYYNDTIRSLKNTLKNDSTLTQNEIAYIVLEIQKFETKKAKNDEWYNSVKQQNKYRPSRRRPSYRRY